MADLKIKVFRDDESEPESTITIPIIVLRVASRIIPKNALDVLQEKGINLEEIIRLSDNPDIHGPLVIVEEHKKKEKIIISLENC